MDRTLSRRGFSLVELLTVLGLGLVLVAGLLSLFRVHAAVARRQSQTADLQQSLRIARHELARFCRMAGRGGLPADAAAAVRNNVAPGSRIGGPGTPGVVPGTDVLVVRGVFEGAMLEAAATGGRGPGPSPSAGGIAGGLTLSRRRETGAGRDLEVLARSVNRRQGEALLLSDGSGSVRCAVVELTGVAGSRSEDGALVELDVEVRSSGSEAADGYRRLARGCSPMPPSAVSRAGLLEEHRFYLRRDGRPAGAGSRHRLSRVRFYPGSDRVHPSSPKTGVALVDYALDLQAALGFDLDGDGSIVEDPGAGRGADEWLYNDPRDASAAGSWPRERLELIRATLMLRAARATRGHVAPRRERLEDHVHDPAAAPWDPESRLFLRASTSVTVRRRNR